MIIRHVAGTADERPPWLDGITAADIPLMSTDEHSQVLAMSRRKVQDPAQLKTGVLAGQFSANAAHAPDSPAISCGGAVASYGEIERSSNQLARLLLSLGMWWGLVAGCY